MFPNQRAAEIAVETVRNWLDETGSGMKVVFNVSWNRHSDAESTSSIMEPMYYAVMIQLSVIITECMNRPPVWIFLGFLLLPRNA